jgi:hypothetical protein
MSLAPACAAGVITISLMFTCAGLETAKPMISAMSFPESGVIPWYTPDAF